MTPTLVIEAVLTVTVALITALLGPVAVEWAKSKFAKKSKDVIAEAIDKDGKVDHQLELIMEEIQCDRICISQFHNGGNFYPTGKSIKKFSIFYEKINEHAHSIKETFQNIPVSLFPKVFSTLHKQGEIIITKCSNNKSECGLFPVIGKEYKTKSFYMLAIKDLNDNFIGSMAISYYKKEHVLSLDEWILLRQKVGAIGTILTYYLHNRK